MATPTVFQGIAALDFTQGFAGPLATMIMADNGAEVTRVEPPSGSGHPGDPCRSLAGYRQWQRGKKRLVANLKDPKDLRRVRELAERADVLVESSRPGVMDRLGLGYEGLAAKNPGLVYCSITGFGPRGKHARYKAYEGVVQAVAGRMADFGRMFALGRPAFPAVPVAGFGASQAALQGIAAALFVRHRTGQGQRVETSLLQGMTPYDMASWLPAQRPETRMAGGYDVPYPPLGYVTARTRDGKWVQFANWAPHLFWSMVEALGLGHIKQDPRFAPLPRGASPEDSAAFWEMLLKRVGEKTFDEWMEVFVASGEVGADAFCTTESGMDHPQVRHNGHVVEVWDPEVGRSEQIGPLVSFGETPSRIPFADGGTAGGVGALPRGGRPAGRPYDALGALPQRALSGVTALELAVQYAAPFGPTLLADLGARVIKIEPLTGDTMRESPALATKTTQGKESIAIDLKTAEGQAIVHKLVQRADLLMHNYRPGVPQRLGIDYPTLRRINPRLVYLYAGLYGADGPHSPRPGYHCTPGGICGNAWRQAGEGYPPPPEAELPLEKLKEVSLRLSRANEGNPDPNAAVVVATAMLLGLLARERHGVGQEMQTTMVNSSAYAMSDDWIRYEGKRPRKRLDASRFGLGALYRLYQAKEGWVFLACVTEQEWQDLCASLDEPALARDPRFADPQRREASDAALAQRLAAAFQRRTADEWEQALTARNVGCVRADGQSFAQFFGSDPSVRENGFITDVDDPVYGRIWRHGHTVHMSRTPGILGRSMPVGEHTQPIMREFGYSDQEIAALKARRVVHYP